MGAEPYLRYREFRPHWRAFAVYFFGVLVFWGGPLINPEAAINPALSELIGTAFLAFIFVKRYTSIYRLSTEALEVETSMPRQRRALVPVKDITRIDLRRGLTQRIMRVAHVHIYVGGEAAPAAKLFGVPDPDDFKQLLKELGAGDELVTGAFRK